MVRNRPVAIVVAGPNGSGKTSLTRKLLLHEWASSASYINPDEIAQHTFGDWNSPEAVLKAAKLAEERRNACLEAGTNFCFETVLSTPSKVDFLLACKQRGFFVRMFFVGTNSPEINAARVARRVMTGGHDVPIRKIVSRYVKSLSLGFSLASLVDRAYFYDNSVEDQDPRLILRLSDGQLAKLYEHPAPEWLAPLVEGAALPGS